MRRRTILAMSYGLLLFVKSASGGICGNGVIEPQVGEECEILPPGSGSGSCPLGRCNPTDCRCTPICTLAAPCAVHNGENGPYIAPFDPNYGGVFAYSGDPQVPAFAADFCGSQGVDTLLRVFDANSSGPAIASNDDCCDPSDPVCGAFGIGSTPNASCYDQVTSPNYESCTCVAAIPGNSYLIQLARLAPIGASIRVNINKKASCGGAILGSCCDSNGPDVGCTDNVEQTACVGADKRWNNEKCAYVTCMCVPDCASRACGDDGCGGSCGTCNDGASCTIDACVDGQCTYTPSDAACDDHIACNGIETCGAAGCVVGTPVNCNDNVACTLDACAEPSGTCTHVPRPVQCDDGLYCNGPEICTPTGCAAGTPPCISEEICDEAAHTCSPRFTAIPTVSQWGTVVIALAILVLAKVSGSRSSRRIAR